MLPDGAIEVDDMSDDDEKRGQNSSSVFTQQVSPVTGQMEWVSHDANYDFYQEIARSDYGDMLHDTDRNLKYEAGLKATITYLKQSKPSSAVRVLDIGTGSGLLSMMAARILQQIGEATQDRIVACEAFDPIAKVAREIVKANGYDSAIRIVNKRSTQLTVADLADGGKSSEEEKATVCVAEVFDTELIGEGALRTFRHAAENLLVHQAYTVPARAHVYALPVRSAFLSHFGLFRTLKLPQCDVQLEPPSGAIECAGGTLLFDLQLSSLEPFVHFEPLCDPILAYTFDFNSAESLQYDEMVKSSFVVSAAKVRESYFSRLSDAEKDSVKCKVGPSSTVDCVLFWWTTQMVDDRVAEALQLDVSDYTITCAPTWVPKLFPKEHALTPSWRDHWISAVYFPKPPLVTAEEGRTLQLLSAHDECSLWFDVRENSEEKVHERVAVHSSNREQFDKSKPFCSCTAHNGFAKQRVAFLNNLDGWWTEMARLLQRHAARFADDATVVVISDGSPLGVLVRRLLPNVNVIQLDRGQITKRIAIAYARSNLSTATDSSTSFSKWSLATNMDELVEAVRAVKGDVCAVLAEPFFSFAVLPWHSLHFGFALHELFSKLQISVPFITPRSAKLCAALVQFDNLHATRAEISKCERFDLTAFEGILQSAQEKARECGAAELHALYEYPGKLLSRSVCLRQFDFTEGKNWLDTNSDVLFEPVRFEITTDQREWQLNGIAFWMEYEMDAEWSYSTGLLPQAHEASKWYDMWNVCCKQAVFLYRKPRVFSAANRVAHCDCRFRLKLATGDLICEATEVEFS